MSRSGTLLLNWVFYNPIGHVAEALKVAKGLYDNNPGIELSLLLNAAAPYQLAETCPWIARVYPIDTQEALALGADAPSLRRVPREWDDIVNDWRHNNGPFGLAPDLAAFHKAAETYFVARRWRNHPYDHPPESGAPLYVRDTPIRIPIPEDALAFAASLPDGRPRIALLMAGSSPESIYPTLGWWTRLLRALGRAFPEARFYLTGLSQSDEGHTITHAYPRDALDDLFRRVPRSVDCYDVGLWRQLALLEHCDALVAPHTGFGSLAPCVGTPWVAISGVRWPEYLFNQVPFYAVLPSCPRYPCYAAMKPACQRRIARQVPVLCMDDRQLGPRIPDVIDGLRRVLDPGFTYQEAVELYRHRVAAAGSARSQFFSWERSVSV